VLTFRRFHKGRWIKVALNFSAEPQRVDVDRFEQWRILLSTELDRANDTVSEMLHLRGNEAVVLGRTA
jgi:hypothetical protein